ncbi:MAG: NAD-binding protein [Paracoccaceae bacterium]
MTKKPLIGFVGVGFMGHGMAKNILLGGYELWIKGNVNRKPVESMVSMGAKVGISPHTFREVIEPSRLGSGFFGTFMKYVRERDENAHKFSLANMSKDNHYSNAMATDAGVMNVMASAARHYFTHAEAVGGGTDFVPMLSDHVGRLNEVDMEAETKK